MILSADGLDDALIGMCSRTGRYIYSSEKCIEILAKEMPPEEALEYFYFNTAGAYVGEGTPIFMEEVQ
jgi:hypothetical protein